MVWGNVTALYSAAHRSADEVLLIDPAPPLSTRRSKCISVHECDPPCASGGRGG